MTALLKRSRPSILQKRRAALEAAVLAAIALLDDMDGDADLEEEPDREAHSDDREPDQDHCVPCYLLHDQTRLGTYAGEAFATLDTDDDPGEFVARCKVGLAR